MVCFEDVTIPVLKVKLQTTDHFEKVIDIYYLFTGKSAHSLLNKELF
jgi:hypothetical protein